MNEPLVTVIMAVYNTGPHLKEAIDSILNQSYRNIEFVIINNGSTDGSAQIIGSYTDKRIKFVNNPGNDKWLEAVNLAMREATGEYIARMDHDDVSSKDRLRKQVNFLTGHPEIGMCGTWMKTFGKDNRIYTFPLTPAECKVQLLFNICMMHPTLVLRKSLADKYNIHYKQEFFPADDIELLAINSDVVQYANIPEVLYMYRSHTGQASHTMFEKHNKLKLQVLLISLKKILPDITNDEIVLHENISSNTFEYTYEFLKKSEIYLKKVLNNNAEIKAFDPSILEKKLQQVWFSICTELASHGLYTTKIYKASSLSKAHYFKWTYIKFNIKNFFNRIKASK